MCHAALLPHKHQFCQSAGQPSQQFCLGMGGALVDVLGYAGTFIVFAGVNLLVLPLMVLLTRTVKETPGDGL